MDRSTFVLHLDMEGWRRLCEANDRMEGAIPHREEVTEMDLTEGNGIGGRGRRPGLRTGRRWSHPGGAENPKGKAKPRGRGLTRPRDSTNSEERGTRCEGRWQCEVGARERTGMNGTERAETAA